MKESDQYLKVVQWSQEDQCYVGTCPGFMLGGVHGDNEIEVYRELCEAVEGWIRTSREDGESLPEPTVPEEPSQTEAWWLAGRELRAPRFPRATRTVLDLYRILGESPLGAEVAEPRVSYGDDLDEPRRELAALIEESVLPWTRVTGWRHDEESCYEIERRIERQLKAARYSRKETERLVPKIFETLTEVSAPAGD